jgi:hypothetical protein
MIGELILIAGLGAGAAGIGFLLYHNAQENRAREDARREQESRFRDALLRELEKAQPTSFSLSRFATKCGVPHEVASEIAEALYGKVYRKVVADGVITPEERVKVTGLARALELGADQVRNVEQRAREETYARALDGAVSDGEITSTEAASLELLRRRLGISRQEAFRLTSDISRSTYLMAFRRIVRDGVVTSEERAELQRWKEALALSDDQAESIIRAEALALYRERFVVAIQDGVVTAEEEANLAWLQRWAGLRDSDVADYHARMKHVKRLAAFREGNLPSIMTRKILEGGETCHWESPCAFSYETRTRSLAANGELVVTSKNVMFLSAVKSLSYRPSKILDIIKYSNALEIKVSARQGSGRYFVSHPDELEAILTGVVRSRKYLLSESFSSATTRHIPDDIKRAAWDRDRGRCVRCGAVEYLEFDHVIPHSRGGANSLNNVQILCRKCNLLKGDRI